MDWATVLRSIEDALASDLGRAEKALQIAELVRRAGSYRWVGLYAVTDHEITAIGWSGPGAPAHPRFPVTQGLSGAAVATGRAVVVNDVTADPRYLTAFYEHAVGGDRAGGAFRHGHGGGHAGCGKRRAGHLH